MAKMRVYVLLIVGGTGLSQWHVTSYGATGTA